MSANAAHFDDNQIPSSMGVIGTLGTADEAGTARSLPFGVDDATGAAWVKVISGTVTSAATLELNSGTITTIQAGTLNTLGTVGTINGIAAGNNNIGNMDVETGTVTLVSNLTSGSVRMTVGTLTQGSLTNLGQVHNAGTLAAGDNNIGNVDIVTGTITSVTNLAGGTVQVNPVPIPTILSHGTLGTAGGSFFATISAASGAGTRHFVSGIDVVMQSGTADVRILAGTAIQGTGVLAAGQFPAGGGISKRLWPVFATGTNSELTYHFVGAGSAFITVQYWKGV